MIRLSSTDRSALIRLASSLPAGDETRRAILSRLKMAEGEEDGGPSGGSGKPSGKWIEFMKAVGDKQTRNPDTGNDVKMKSLKGPKGKKLLEDEFKKWVKDQKARDMNKKVVTKEDRDKADKDKAQKQKDSDARKLNKGLVTKEDREKAEKAKAQKQKDDDARKLNKGMKAKSASLTGGVREAEASLREIKSWLKTLHTEMWESDPDNRSLGILLEKMMESLDSLLRYTELLSRTPSRNKGLMTASKLTASQMSYARSLALSLKGVAARLKNVNEDNTVLHQSVADALFACSLTLARILYRAEATKLRVIADEIVQDITPSDDGSF